MRELSNFCAPSNSGSSFGARTIGYIYPPETREYTFYSAGNDHVTLYLSTDHYEANKVLIAYHEG